MSASENKGHQGSSRNDRDDRQILVPLDALVGAAGESDPEERGFDPLHYFRVLMEHKWLILFSLIAALAFGALQIRQSVPQYTSTAVIMYEPAKIKTMDFGRETGGIVLYSRIDEMANAMELLSSPVIAERVYNSLGSRKSSSEPSNPSDISPLGVLKSKYREGLRLIRSKLVSYEPPQGSSEEDQEQKRIRSLLSGLKVKQRGATRFLEITYTTTDAIRAAQLANSFAEEFLAFTMAEQEKGVQYARTFLMDQIQELKAQLEEAERKAYAYGKESDMILMDESLRVAREAVSGLVMRIEEARTELASHKAEVQAARDDQAQLHMLTQDAFYSGLLTRLSELQIQLVGLEAENMPDNPDVRRVKREIDGITAEIQNIRDRVIDDLEGKQNLAELQLQGLLARFEEQKEKIRALEEEMIQYRVLQREVESTREIYNNLLEQYKRLEVTDDLALSNATLIGRATVNSTPSSPKVSRMLIKFAFLGLFLGVALAVGLDRLDRSVRSPTVVEERLQLPSLAFVPYIGAPRRLRKLSGKKRAPAVALAKEANGQTAPVTDAFRYLRTSLQYATADRPAHVLLVSSCLPKEGKSTIAANLAITFAELGQKTLLVDCDLKKPVQHRAFGVSKSPGMTDLLTGQEDVGKLIRSTDVDGLDVLTAGPTTPSPVNLLDSRAMNDFLRSVKERYDRVIIDSAPCHGMPDSLVLAKKTDGVFLVIRQGSTPRDVLEATVDRLRSLGVSLLGAVYNTTESGRGAAYGYGGYGRKYAYSKYYAYRYDSGDTDSEPVGASGGKS